MKSDTHTHTRMTVSTMTSLIPIWYEHLAFHSSLYVFVPPLETKLEHTYNIHSIFGMVKNSYINGIIDDKVCLIFSLCVYHQNPSVAIFSLKTLFISIFVSFEFSMYISVNRLRKSPCQLNRKFLFLSISHFNF